jgi:hypothetical protein
MMNMFGAYFGSMLMQVSDEMEKANKANKRKIQEAVDKYWEACKYPRKKKKKMRKEAQRDYSFWVSIDKWYEKEFSFLKT